jgi:hypothetical protein
MIITPNEDYQNRRFFTMSKIWICGQVAAQGQEKNIAELVQIFPYFDGAVWTVNYIREDCFDDEDRTYEYLYGAKKDGKILKTVWHNLHSPGMTMFLQAGVIKNGDWVLSIDAQELPLEPWLSTIRDRVKQYDKDGITAEFWGRPYFFEYNDQMTYQPNSTHCWPTPLTAGKHISIVDESKVRYTPEGVYFGDFILNKKNLDDTTLLHAVKYIFCYNITNEMQNQYGSFGSKIVENHEFGRQWFRQWWQEKLGLPTTLEALENYMFGPMDTKAIDYFEFENPFKDFYRFKILKHSREDILKNRYQWSLKDYLDNRKDSGFISTRNKYNQQLGRPLE